MVEDNSGSTEYTTRPAKFQVPRRRLLFLPLSLFPQCCFAVQCNRPLILPRYDSQRGARRFGVGAVE